MTLAIWKQAYYPTEASTVPESEAAEHSLRKWIGLRKENLERHGVSLLVGTVSDEVNDDELEVDGFSCALCSHYWTAYCECCPLQKHLGARCDHGTAEARSPFGSMMVSNDPEPMIAALEAVVAKQKQTQGST